MQYFTSYYFQSDEINASSVLLQQVCHKRRKLPVVLACVCEENTRFRAKDSCEYKYGIVWLRNMADWFYGSCLPLCSHNGERGSETIFDNLLEYMNKIPPYPGENTAISSAGILCVGDSFLLFRQGTQRISLLNTRNHRPYCHEIKMQQGNKKGMDFLTGILQRRVGILLATEGFRNCVPDKRREECLNVQEMRTQERVERRMRELGIYAEEQGGTDLGAILIVTH